MFLEKTTDGSDKRAFMCSKKNISALGLGRVNYLRDLKFPHVATRRLTSSLIRAQHHMTSYVKKPLAAQSDHSRCLYWHFSKTWWVKGCRFLQSSLSSLVTLYENIYDAEYAPSHDKENHDAMKVRSNGGLVHVKFLRLLSFLHLLER